MQLWIFFVIILALILVKIWFKGGEYKGPKGDLTGKVAIVTGGQNGIGAQIVKDLARHNCLVIIADVIKSNKLSQELNRVLGKELVFDHFLDLGDTMSIRTFVSSLQKHQKIDYLVNNAGILTPSNKIGFTKDKMERHFGINYYGHFVLTHMLWKKLNKSSDGFRVINTSSIAHKKLQGFFETVAVDFDNLNFEEVKFSNQLAYSRSKLYVTLITHALAEKISNGKGIVVCGHPGVARTKLIKQFHVGFWNQLRYYVFYIFFWLFTKNTREAAQTALSLIYSPCESLVNGGYYADCKLSQQNPNVTKKNWDKLLEISQKMHDKGCQFGEYP